MILSLFFHSVKRFVKLDSEPTILLVSAPFQLGKKVSEVCRDPGQTPGNQRKPRGVYPPAGFPAPSLAGPFPECKGRLDEKEKPAPRAACRSCSSWKRLHFLAPKRFPNARTFVGPINKTPTPPDSLPALASVQSLRVASVLPERGVPPTRRRIDSITRLRAPSASPRQLPLAGREKCD